MDVEAMNTVLSCLLGSSRSSAMPTTLLLRLWVGDPRLSGATVFDYPEYADQSVSTSTGWAAPSGGVVARASSVAYPDPSDESTDAATHWGLHDPTSDALYFVGFLGELDISSAGDGPRILPRVRVADALILSD